MFNLKNPFTDMFTASQAGRKPVAWLADAYENLVQLKFRTKTCKLTNW